MSKRNHKRESNEGQLHSKPLQIGPYTFEAGKLSKLGNKKLKQITPDERKAFLKEHFGLVSNNFRSEAKAKLKKAQDKGNEEKIQKWGRIVGYYKKVDKDVEFLRHSKKSGKVPSKNSSEDYGLG